MKLNVFDVFVDLDFAIKRFGNELTVYRAITQATTGYRT